MALAETLYAALGATARTLRVAAFDGSNAGPADAPVGLTVGSPLALRHLITGRGSLGLARAFVMGELELHGDAYETLKALTENATDLTVRERLSVLREAVRAGGPTMLRPARPRPKRCGCAAGGIRCAVTARRSRTTTTCRTSFYEWVLGPSMAYTCACYPRPDATLEEAQFNKFDLVARKLGLQPGMRLLDVGCGWGGMVMHAAREYGVSALGVTLSRQQAEWAQKAIAEAGLAGWPKCGTSTTASSTESAFDAVSSIGLTEHIGLKQLPAYFQFLLGKLRPEGRLLNHCIMRPTTDQPANIRNGFINRYVFPDGELEGVGTIVSAMQDNGFEVRHEENLREHYAKTLTHWCANLDAHWDEAVDEVGPNKARVWQLYMAGSRLGFERREIELHQVLGVKTVDGISGMPLRPSW